MPGFAPSVLVPALPVAWGPTGEQTAYTRDAAAYDTRTSAFESYRRRLVDLLPLRRGDIVFVPRSTLGELAAFFTQVRNALPIGFSYAINGSYAST